MKKINGVEIKIRTDNAGYKEIEFTSYSSNKISTKKFIDTCIQELECIRKKYPETKPVWQFWK